STRPWPACARWSATPNSASIVRWSRKPSARAARTATASASAKAFAESPPHLTVGILWVLRRGSCLPHRSHFTYPFAAGRVQQRDRAAGGETSVYRNTHCSTLKSDRHAETISCCTLYLHTSPLMQSGV